MHRSESKKRKEERKEINIISNKTLPTTRETEETLAKLLSATPYIEEDITKHAKIILEQYNQNYNQQFKLLINDNFDQVFKNINIEEKKPNFVIFEKQKNRWVLFCLTRQRDINFTLYKDSSGSDVPSKLVQELKKQFSSMEFVLHKGEEQKIDEDYNYGPFCLRNLEIMLDFLKNEPNDFVEKFPNVKFFQMSNLNRDKINNVIKLTLDLSQNDKFKIALKDFINKLPLEVTSDILDYKKVLEEEFEKENIDHDKIKQARLRFLNEENINKLQNNYKLQKAESEEYELDIQKDFPKEMETLCNIFMVLDKIKVDKQLFAALENISLILNIDVDKMKSFYESRIENEEETRKEKLTPENIEIISEKLPEIKTHSTTENCTPLDKLLPQITIGMDQEDSSSKEIQEDIHQIEEKYNLVKSKYEFWKKSTINEIHAWATAKKGHLANNNEDICETIAIANRAFTLLTGGFSLRDTQILAVLVFFHGSSNQGRLCQIKTGEGKTVIISLLAVIKALQGWTVDVITSNSLLAADGVAETKRFYSVFNLTVSTNNPAEGEGNFKIGYSADVLYGTISNFQFDYLKDSFEGFNIRNGRKFGQVILDEVDSMLVDNGGHIAKLASPFPGMECLRYIYINIWEQLQIAEDSFAKEIQGEIETILKQCSKNKEEARLQYEKFIQKMVSQERKNIKEKIKANNPIDVCLIPQHLKEYVRDKLDVWLKNALHAKYNCHEHQQYRIMKNDTGDEVVTPVDYLNTGVTLKNTIWSNGLHQFVQLKHNLYLTFESLTSSFISNIGYIKCYRDENIFGLTGTLGSQAEQELLSSIYNVNYAKLPTYKEKIFEELPGLIFEDKSWPIKVTLEILSKIDERRAVLAIFETEEDLLSIKKNLELIQNGDFRIRNFAHEENARETEERVKVGDIILATNIAGRGTNFKTEESLEINGGLHIYVGFLPCNLRVEGQAFGRTSRQGNKGTAQLVIRKSEVDELGIIESNPSFTKIKQERDSLESKRLDQINNELVKELNFKDKLFKKFSIFYTNLKQNNDSREYGFVLQDLKEFWAFWLEKKNFNASNIQTTTEEDEFRKFTKEAETITKGTISHNPLYCVALADCYSEQEKNRKAKNELKRALEIGGPNNFELLAGVHLKLFEIAISEGEQIKERFKKAVANIFFVHVEKNEKYKQEAENCLKCAKQAIQKEINYIKTHLIKEETVNEDFEAILHQNFNQNLLVKHLYSRLHCLNFHDSNIDNLLESLEKYSRVDFSGTAETTLENITQLYMQLKDKFWEESEHLVSDLPFFQFFH
ncbi:protein translocase subunit SecA-like isoform X2 [Tribolium madens]|uniref:protein translocase subunit SecA-like isoform X2 n=1 Tax=Tribolium madens TaxID=41895 RepID=UPI001CF7533E|nr:protein translocase subunit SecA-like isoform X2 [Tribolium madens]